MHEKILELLEYCIDSDEDVFTLTRGKKPATELYNDGIEEIKDIPSTFELKPKHQIQWKCAVNGCVHVDKEPTKKFLDALNPPSYYFDFEAFMTAIPMFDGTHAYQRMPFQYSIHVDGEHREFLYDGSGDPRRELIENMIKDLGFSGNIVVFFEGYEKSVLLELTRDFHYYNSSQKGSASLKKVLPALTGKDYSHLDIQNGGMAFLEFLRVQYKGGSDKEKVREALLKYCELDTESMVWIVEELKKLIKE